MNRRNALKGFALAGAAALVLPGCFSENKKVSIALNNLKITADDEELMASLAQTLIPSVDGKPGAKEVGAHHFAFVMIDDCKSPEEKDKFLKGMRDFGSKVVKKFASSSDEERKSKLAAFEKELSSADENVGYFYSNARHYIIQGYTTSQYFLTEVKPYKLVPGAVFKGCVPLSENA